MDEFEKDMELEEIQELELSEVEEEPEIENTQSKPKKKKKRKLKKFAKYGLVLILICIVIVVYNFMGCNKQSITDIYKLESGASDEICEYDGNILMLGYDGAKMIDLDGQEEYNIKYHMANPHMDVCEDMILLYDKNDQKFAVYDAEEKLYSYTCENKIKSAKVNENGDVVLITDENGYNYKVSVIVDGENGVGKEIYFWKIGDEYIVDIDISPDGEKLVAATVKTETGRIVQNVVMVDVDKAVELGRSTVADVMPLRVNFTDKASAVVISDDRICGYNEKAGIEWEDKFENRLLDNYAIDKEGNSVVALRGIKNNSVIRSYTSSGKNSGEYVTDTKANHVDLNSKYVAVCEYNKLSLVDYSGAVVSALEIKKEVLDVAVISDDKVVILCKDCIQLLRM